MKHTGNFGVEIDVIETTTVEKRAKITVAQIKKAFNIPANATVTFHVPGGGDCSDMDLDVEQLDATWTETRKT